MLSEFHLRSQRRVPAATLFAAVAFLSLSAVPAVASIITFSAEDLNAGPGDAHPNSTAAAASFDAAASLLGTNSIINF